MSDPIGESVVNLATIIGRATDNVNTADRVVSFSLGDNSLYVNEECDEYFSVELDPPELDALIAWLTARRNHMTPPPIQWVSKRPSEMTDLEHAWVRHITHGTAFDPTLYDPSGNRA